MQTVPVEDKSIQNIHSESNDLCDSWEDNNK